jgi:histidinol dehydrogenase
MIKIYKYGEVADSEVFSRVVPEFDVAAIVSDIIKNVRENGDAAVLDYNNKMVYNTKSVTISWQNFKGGM